MPRYTAARQKQQSDRGFEPLSAHRSDACARGGIDSDGRRYARASAKGPREGPSQSLPTHASEPCEPLPYANHVRRRAPRRGRPRRGRSASSRTTRVPGRQLTRLYIVEQDRGTSVIAAAIDEWPSSLEGVLLGTSDPARIVGLLDGFLASALGGELQSVTFYRRGVGAVFGLLLTDSRKVVVKVHRVDLVGDALDGIRTVQRTLADQGLPAPTPIGKPQAMGNGIGAAEEMLTGGDKVNPHDASVRRVLASGLFQFVEAATPMLGIVRLPLANPFGLPDDQLWPTPHDLRFDFSLPGAEWIDELAKDARSVLDQSASEPMVIGHADWRIENLRMDRSAVVAIFDWDSVCTCPEAVLVAAASVHFTTDWSDSSTDPFPSPDESSAFVNEYEEARGRRFASRDRELVDAAQIYRLAYGARCEHSDSLLGVFPDVDGGERGFAALLRSVTT